MPDNGCDSSRIIKNNAIPLLITSLVLVLLVPILYVFSYKYILDIHNSNTTNKSISIPLSCHNKDSTSYTKNENMYVLNNNIVCNSSNINGNSIDFVLKNETINYNRLPLDNCYIINKTPIIHSSDTTAKLSDNNLHNIITYKYRDPINNFTLIVFITISVMALLLVISFIIIYIYLFKQIQIVILHNDICDSNDKEENKTSIDNIRKLKKDFFR